MQVLKIKDNVDLDILKKLGFIEVNENDFDYKGLLIFGKDRILNLTSNSRYIPEIIYRLTKLNCLEVVEDK